MSHPPRSPRVQCGFVCSCPEFVSRIMTILYFLYISIPLLQLHKTSDCTNCLSTATGSGCCTEPVTYVQFSGNVVISYFVVNLSTRLLQSKQRIQIVFSDCIFPHYTICRRLRTDNRKHQRHEIMMHLVTKR